MTPTPALRESKENPPARLRLTEAASLPMLMGWLRYYTRLLPDNTPSPPPPDLSRGHTSASLHRDGGAKQEARRHTNTPWMDDLVRLCSGHLPDEHNKCPSVWHTRQQTYARTHGDWDISSFLPRLCRAMPPPPAVTDASQQYATRL